MKMLRVISKKDGFRRAGRAWTGVTEVPAGEFNKTQLAALMAEPKLVVQEFDAAPATSPAPSGDSGSGGSGAEGGSKVGKVKPKE